MARITRTEARMIAEELHALMRGDIRQAATEAATEQTDDMLTAQQAADLLGCSLSKVYHSLDRLPHTRLPGGRKLVFSRAALIRRLTQPN